MTEKSLQDLAGMVLRIARPTDQMDRLVDFYSRGLGLRVIGQFKNHNGYDGVMLGNDGSPYHLEFTTCPGHPAEGTPSDEHLLVFYLPDEARWRRVIDRIEQAGYQSVRSRNPYWDKRGKTYEDPDGYRVVIQNAAWPSARSSNED